MTKVLLLLPFLGWLILGPISVAQEAQAPEGKATLKLVSGDTMTGTVGPVRDGAVSLITEYGVVRVPVSKLSTESKKQLGISEATDAESLKRRVAELEALVSKLREENVALRQASTQTPAPAVRQPFVSGVGGNATTAQRAQVSSGSGGSYRISSTGKRHNARCRYYSSNGRAGSANEGVACKICGG